MWREWEAVQPGHPDIARRINASIPLSGPRQARMTNLPTLYAVARIAAFLEDHLSWSAYWDKHYALWRVAEDDTDSDIYAESRDADVVIRYIVAHSRDATVNTAPGPTGQAGPIAPSRPGMAMVLIHGDTLEPGQRVFAPVVKLVRTRLWIWGRGRPWGLVWCSKEATTQRWGLTSANRVRPVFCMNSSTA